MQIKLRESIVFLKVDKTCLKLVENDDPLSIRVLLTSRSLLCPMLRPEASASSASTTTAITNDTSN